MQQKNKKINLTIINLIMLNGSHENPIISLNLHFPGMYRRGQKYYCTITSILIISTQYNANVS